MLPALEPSNGLAFYCKTHGNGYRTTQGGLPNVQYEPREFPVVYSVGSQDQSAKRISRGSLQIAILALTVGAITGAGAVFALVGHPSHQYTASLTAPPPAIQQAANLPTPEPASDGQRKVSAETPEHAAPRGPPVAAASAAMRASAPNGSASHGTDRTSALDVTSSLERTTSKEPNNAPLRMERKRHGRVTVGNHDWRPSDRFVFLPVQRDAQQLFFLRLF
jgi:hypothetical protein